MNKKTLTYRNRYLTLAEAAERVTATDDLLTALIHGVITARGWSGYWPPTGPAEPTDAIEVPENKIIEPGIWKIATEQTNCKIDWIHSRLDIHDFAGWEQNLGISDITLPVEEFEAAFPARADNHTQEPSRTGAPGRPSSMHLIMQEFERREAVGQLLGTLSAESKHLSSWLQEAHPQASPPTPKTIMNRLRERYRGVLKPTP
jgi:hypothetical protein